MEMLIIKEDSNEWNHMWNWVANHPLNDKLTEPTAALHEGEAWQYMGSLRSQDGRVVSEFRHRNHPFDGTRKNVVINHPNGVPDSDIELIRKVK